MAKRIAVFLLAAAALLGQAQAQVVERIVAVVNDEVITLTELNRAFEPYVDKVRATYRGGDLDGAMAEAKSALLSRMIDELLMEQQARKAKIAVKEEEVDAAIKDVLARRKITIEDLQRSLAREGSTMAAYRKGIRDQIVRFRLVQREVRSRVAVSDEEIGEYYRRHRDEYEGKEAVRIRQILFPLPRGADPAARQALRSEAEALSRRLAAGEPFDRLFAQYAGGRSPSAADVGYVERGVILPEVESVAFGLPVGGVSQVIESTAGFHLIQVTDRRGAGLKSLEAVRGEIREHLEQQKMEKKFEEWLAELRQRSHIEVKL